MTINGVQVCDCGCRRVLRCGDTSTVYTIKGKPEVYATKACRDGAFDGKRVPRADPVRQESMKVSADDFGADTGVTRTRCDSCHGLVSINWRGPNGEDFCSNECRKAGKQIQGENFIMSDTQTETVNVPDNPIAGASSSTKKSKKSKKASKTAAPAKTAAPKKAASKTTTTKAAKPAKSAAQHANGNGAAGRKSRYSDDAILKVVNADPGYRDGTRRSDLFKAIKNGMKLGAFKTKADAKDAMSFLTWYVKQGVVEVQDSK